MKEKQLSLFEETETNGGKLLAKGVSYISILKEGDLKGQIETKLDKIFNVYKKYDPNLERPEQLYEAGSWWVKQSEVGMPEEEKKLFHPTTLEELNGLITRLIHLSGDMVSSLSSKAVGEWLILTYVYILAEFKKHLEV